MLKPDSIKSSGSRATRQFSKIEVAKAYVIAGLTNPGKYGIEGDRMMPEEIGSELANPSYLKNNADVVEAVLSWAEKNKNRP